MLYSFWGEPDYWKWCNVAAKESLAQANRQITVALASAQPITLFSAQKVPFTYYSKHPNVTVKGLVIFGTVLWHPLVSLLNAVMAVVNHKQK